MNKKILVLCKLENELVAKYLKYIEYLPLSNKENDRTCEEVLEKF